MPCIDDVHSAADYAADGPDASVASAEAETRNTVNSGNDIRAERETRMHIEDGLNETIGDNEGGADTQPKGYADAPEHEVRAAAKELLNSFYVKDENKQKGYEAAALEGERYKADLMNSLNAEVSSTTVANVGWWAKATTYIASHVMDACAGIDHYLSRFAATPGLSLLENPIVKLRHTAVARVNGVKSRIIRDVLKPIQQTMSPYADHFGQNLDTFIAECSEHANALHALEANDKLLMDWKTRLEELEAIPEEEREPSETKMIADLRKSIGDLEYNREEYLSSGIDTAEYASDGKCSIKSSGLTYAEAQKTMERLEKKYGKELFDKLDPMLTQAYEYINGLELKAGVISPEMARETPTFVHYVPMLSGRDTTYSIVDTNVYHPGNFHVREGRYDRPDNSWMSLRRYTDRAAANIGQQEYGLALLQLAQHHKRTGIDGGLKLIDYRQMASAANSEDRGFADYAKDMLRIGGIIVNQPTYDVNGNRMAADKQLLVMFDPKWTDTTSESGRINYTGSDLNKAMIAAPKIENGLARAAMASTTGMGRLYTQFRPVFAPVNFMRDAGERLAQMLGNVYTESDGSLRINGSSLAPKFISNCLYRIPSQMHKLVTGNYDHNSVLGKYWDEYVTLGLKQDYALGDMPGDKPTGISKLLADPKMLGVRNALKKLDAATAHIATEKLRNWNDSFNNSASFSHYVTLREAGFGLTESSSAALAPMNMTQTGRYTPVMRCLWPFVKPTIQSAAATARALGLAYDPRGFWKGGKRSMLAMAGMYTAGLALVELMKESMGKDEDGNYYLDGMPSYKLAQGIHIGIGNGQAVMLPTGFGIPQLILTLAHGTDRMNRGLANADDVAGDLVFTFCKNISPANWPEFNVKQHPTQFIMQLMAPSVIGPIAQSASNTDFFGKPIDYMAGEQFGKSKAYGGNASASKGAHEVAHWLFDHMGIDMSPNQIEGMMNGYAIGPLKFVEWSLGNIWGNVGKQDTERYKAEHLHPFLVAAGASLLYSGKMHPARSLYFHAREYYSNLLKNNHTDLTTHPKNLREEELAAWRADKLRSEGYSDNKIADILVLYEAEKAVHGGKNKEVNDMLRNSLISADTREEFLEKLAASEEQNYSLYSTTVSSLNLYKGMNG